MRRAKYIQLPHDGDYVMRFTGLTWSVLRRTGTEGGAFIISFGHPDRKAALSQVQSLTERDLSDGWESIGDGWFREITHFRGN